jgi:hypothetical protein
MASSRSRWAVDGEWDSQLFGFHADYLYLVLGDRASSVRPPLRL